MAVKLLCAFPHFEYRPQVGEEGTPDTFNPKMINLVLVSRPERPAQLQFRSPPAFRHLRHALLDMGANPRLMK